MPKFLTGCHYNEEEISRHLKKSIGDWPVQINGNKFATGQILKKPVEVVKARGGFKLVELKSLPNPVLKQCWFIFCALFWKPVNSCIRKAVI